MQNRTLEAVLKIAAWQIGVMEFPAGSNKVKYCDEYGTVGGMKAYPWCVAFVWWVFREAGFNLFKTASCGELYNKYKKDAPAQIVRGNYRPGDLVFFDFSGKRLKKEHIGIVEAVKGNTLITIEGNTGTTNDANGGAVMRRTRELNKVTCGIRPNYPDA